MNYALFRLSQSMAPELAKYGIECKPQSNIVIYREVARKLPAYADTRVCKRILKDMIKAAKERKQKVATENQTNLLEGL